jgi:hypothetical protein
MVGRFSIIFWSNCDTNALINGKLTSEFIKSLSVFLFEWLFNLFFVAEAYERLSANALIILRFIWCVHGGTLFGLEIAPR